jgi:predicted TIM-barrel fold metal-dependent hydrolase
VGFGWHVQINIEAGPILELAELWKRLPATLVIDHMGHIREPQGVDHPASKYILELVDKGRTWVKLSITYDSSKDGPPGCADVNRVGAAYVNAAPDRMVWGSNWPHPNETTKPDDALLFDQLAHGRRTRASAIASWSTTRRRSTVSRRRERPAGKLCHDFRLLQRRKFEANNSGGFDDR